MKESIYDLIVTEMVERQKLVKDELKERFKKTKPFQQTEVSSKELLVQYDELTPERIQRMREEFGNESVDLYLNNIAKIQERYKGV